MADDDEWLPPERSVQEPTRKRARQGDKDAKQAPRREVLPKLDPKVKPNAQALCVALHGWSDDKRARHAEQHLVHWRARASLSDIGTTKFGAELVAVARAAYPSRTPKLLDQVLASCLLYAPALAEAPLRAIIARTAAAQAGESLSSTRPPFGRPLQYRSLGAPFRCLNLVFDALHVGGSFRVLNGKEKDGSAGDGSAGNAKDSTVTRLARIARERARGNAKLMDRGQATSQARRRGFFDAQQGSPGTYGLSTNPCGVFGPCKNKGQRGSGDDDSRSGAGPRSGTSSSFRGVTAIKNRASGELSGWQAQITVRGQNHYLGKFETQEQAALAYDRAAVMYYGEGCVLNFEKDRSTAMPAPRPRAAGAIVKAGSEAACPGADAPAAATAASATTAQSSTTISLSVLDADVVRGCRLLLRLLVEAQMSYRSDPWEIAKVVADVAVADDADEAAECATTKGKTDADVNAGGTCITSSDGTEKPEPAKPESGERPVAQWIAEALERSVGDDFLHEALHELMGTNVLGAGHATIMDDSAKDGSDCDEKDRAGEVSFAGSGSSIPVITPMILSHVLSAHEHEWHKRIRSRRSRFLVPTERERECESAPFVLCGLFMGALLESTQHAEHCAKENDRCGAGQNMLIKVLEHCLSILQEYRVPALLPSLNTGTTTPVITSTPMRALNSPESQIAAIVAQNTGPAPWHIISIVQDFVAAQPTRLDSVLDALLSLQSESSEQHGAVTWYFQRFVLRPLLQLLLHTPRSDFVGSALQAILQRLFNGPAATLLFGRCAPAPCDDLEQTILQAQDGANLLLRWASLSQLSRRCELPQSSTARTTLQRLPSPRDRSSPNLKLQVSERDDGMCGSILIDLWLHCWMEHQSIAIRGASHVLGVIHAVAMQHSNCNAAGQPQLSLSLRLWLAWICAREQQPSADLTSALQYVVQCAAHTSRSNPTQLLHWRTVLWHTAAQSNRPNSAAAIADALSSCALDLPSMLATAHGTQDCKSCVAVRDVRETLELVLFLLSVSVRYSDAGGTQVIGILQNALSSAVTISALLALLAGSASSAGISDEYGTQCAGIRTAVFRIFSGRWWQGLGPLPLLFFNSSATDKVWLSPNLHRALLQEAARSITARSWEEARAAAALLWELASPQMHAQRPKAASSCARTALPLLLSKLTELRCYALQARAEDCADVRDDVNEASWPTRARTAETLSIAIARRALPSVSESVLTECVKMGSTLPLD